jgi:hypothetical protein
MAPSRTPLRRETSIYDDIAKLAEGSYPAFAQQSSTLPMVLAIKIERRSLTADLEGLKARSQRASQKASGQKDIFLIPVIRPKAKEDVLEKVLGGMKI